MTTNQEGRLASVQTQTGTALGNNGDWLTLFANEGFTTGTFNGRFLGWLNGRLSASYATLPQAMEAFAANQGYTRWSDIPSIPSAGPPSFPGVSLLLSLDTSSASTISFGTGSSISQLRDKSGNNNHASQATGSAQPTLQTAAQNGLNTVGFASASSQFFNLTSGITIGPYTFACVIAKPLAGNVLIPLGSAAAGVYALNDNSDSKLYAYDSVANVATTSAITFSTAYKSVITSMTGILGTDVLYYNGVSQPVSINSNFATSPLVTIGKSSTAFSDGSIAELILYNSALSPAQVTQLYNYLKAKWGTP